MNSKSSNFTIFMFLGIITLFLALVFFATGQGKVNKVEYRYTQAEVTTTGAIGDYILSVGMLISSAVNFGVAGLISVVDNSAQQITSAVCHGTKETRNWLKKSNVSGNNSPDSFDLTIREIPTAKADEAGLKSGVTEIMGESDANSASSENSLLATKDFHVFKRLLNEEIENGNMEYSKVLDEVWALRGEKSFDEMLKIGQEKVRDIISKQ